MGHDITAYKFDQIAYYRRSAFCKENPRLYHILDCEKANGGVSGLGDILYFDRPQIEKAFQLALKNKWIEETDFLQSILDSEENEILIWFR